MTRGEIRKGLEAQLSKRLGLEATPEQVIAARKQAAKSVLANSFSALA